MSKKAKIILFLVIGLLMLGLVLYGLFYSKKLDSHKITSVDSNINDYLYDETKDTIDLEEEEEDLDGEEAEIEDDDFEVYEEEGDWGDEEDTGTKIAEVERKPEIEETKNDDGELEALYDNRPTLKEEPKIKKEAPKTETPEEKKSNGFNFQKGNYLVIVGSFGSLRNAKKKIKALEEVGFEGEIIQLEGSKLQTVIAGRFASESEAEKLATEIKDKELKAIVKKE